MYCRSKVFNMNNDAMVKFFKTSNIQFYTGRKTFLLDMAKFSQSISSDFFSISSMSLLWSLFRMQVNRTHTFPGLALIQSHLNILLFVSKILMYNATFFKVSSFFSFSSEAALRQCKRNILM